MNRVLVLFAHPALEKSRVNRRLVEAAKGLDGVTFRDLYELYPDFDVEIPVEQEILEQHDVLVLQHPFFWYSIPPLLKQWIDLVLEHGWAYGSEGKALVGKHVVSAISTGGSQSAYRHGGHNRFTMSELLAPLEQTFVLCGMVYLPPFVVHGAHRMAVPTIEGHARDYRRLLEALRDGTLDLAAAREVSTLNQALETGPGGVD